ncbi:hypothetical protein D3C86_1806590 [compost metagenome]
MAKSSTPYILNRSSPPLTSIIFRSRWALPIPPTLVRPLTGALVPPALAGPLSSGVSLGPPALPSISLTSCWPQ